ncbi:dephospho-CoA kinase [Thermodesulfovibrionales bacterium]|nr:dephospho-CoA kinase [Thermodesulfovibrionales bacterium]MCL0034201.1 dephospho-CoA kinase [Thermodesulfovibrionales bacterium]MCL0046939.1 dephospho-CoA kinase [Thermodesulfovibrionales bacterium]MCL0051365.1 dephospho-CoA kinase [Thermodesulfovibrionales bacterium]MCL0083367.1 dephospho-CoA kinase [Thermodesulfovibrionales bacterium]
MMLVVGLTGNYGMGKSRVALMFKEAGSVTIDTDAVVRKLLGEPAVIDEIKGVFGEDIAQENLINKERLADLVFQHPHLRVSLEDILHPEVFKRIDEELAMLSNNTSAAVPIVVIIEAPLIFERGYQDRFDKIITVFTSEEVAISRLKKKGIGEGDVRRRIESQLPIGVKITRSDFTIDNNGDLENTKRQVEAIYQTLVPSCLSRRV